jgi:hypothetical protein
VWGRLDAGAGIGVEEEGRRACGVADAQGSVAAVVVDAADNAVVVDAVDGAGGVAGVVESSDDCDDRGERVARDVPPLVEAEPVRAVE